MASSRRQNISCATCGKTAGIFTCRGCSENFCLPHTNEHREFLEKQMQDVIIIHNQLKDSISGESAEEFHNSLMQQIQQWEEQSINKVRHVANDVRQRLLNTVHDHTDTIKEKLAQITQQLNKARHDGEFFEHDLREWSEKLNKFRQLLNKQQNLRIHHEKHTGAFISKISLQDLTGDRFAKSTNETFGDAEDANTSDDEYEDYSEIKDKDAYTSGEHSMRFKIDQYGQNSSILFGIISKNGSEDMDPYQNPTLYGWTGNNIVYRAGSPHSNFGGFKSNIQTEDIITLVINCDRAVITLINERTRQKYDLDVDTKKCPFPWQSCVRFFSNQE